MLQIQHFYTIFIGIFINQVQRNKKRRKNLQHYRLFHRFLKPVPASHYILIFL